MRDVNHFVTTQAHAKEFPPLKLSSYNPSVICGKLVGRACFFEKFHPIYDKCQSTRENSRFLNPKIVLLINRGNLLIWRFPDNKDRIWPLSYLGTSRV